jgi:hypothetical protein
MYPSTKKLPFTFDVDQINAELKSFGLKEYQYYDVMPLRSPAHLVDPDLPEPPPALDYADGTWTPWLNNKELNNLPNLSKVIEFFQEHCTVNLVRLMRLGAKSTIKMHTDPTLGLHVEKSMIRLTIPITSNKEAPLQLAGDFVEMNPGECWYIDFTQPHQIQNSGASERINMSIDIIPNDWVKELIINN